MVKSDRRRCDQPHSRAIEQFRIARRPGPGNQRIRIHQIIPGDRAARQQTEIRQFRKRRLPEKRDLVVRHNPDFIHKS